MPTPESTRRIVVVGASLGGLRAAEQLRGAGWEGEILVFGEEPHMPYNRPPLSKAALTGPATAAEAHAGLAFRPRRSATDVTWRLGTPVVSADLASRSITTGEGERIEYDGLVIATGLRPARLDVPGPMRGRHVVRTIEDTLALQGDLVPGARVVVVGAGFIGCEVAATAASLGAAVTLVEGASGPLERSVGQELSRGVRALLRSRGIRCIPGARVSEFLAPDPAESNPRSEAACSGVRLSDGTLIPADAVVEAVGSHANVEWLEGNGLDLSDGVLCDGWMRVEGTDGTAVAVGDVARFPDRLAGGPARRVEHWATPSDTAKIAAPALLAALRGHEAPEPEAHLPSFWSDLFGIRIQGVGSPALADEVIVLEGDPGKPESGVALSYWRAGRLIAVVTCGLPADRHLRYRQDVAAACAPASAAA